MKYGDKGTAVRALQQALLHRGYALPTYGADGDLGTETLTALLSFARDGAFPWRIDIPDRILDSLSGGSGGGDLMVPDYADIEIIDLRSEQSVPSPKSKVRRGKTLGRDPAQVTGVVLHQTACVFGVSSAQLARAGGDRRLAKARRALNVSCHALAFRDGFVVLPNYLEYFLFHGNGFNSYTLGLEIEGKYPGVDSDPYGTTWGGAPTPLTGEIVDTARAALKHLVEEGRAAGMPLVDVYAHRQSSATRRSDPGEGLWRAVVLDYGVPILGLETHPAAKVGSGRAIPSAWDPSGVGKY